MRPGPKGDHSADMEVRNRLLRLVPGAERDQLLMRCERIELHPRQVLHHWRLPIQNVYFIESGMVSVSAKVDENRFVAAWLVGSEGMIGAPLVLAGEDRHPAHRRVVQVGGTALRLSAEEFVRILPKTPVLRAVVLRYVSVVLLQASQSGACNTVHRLRQRLARWLLVASNALQSPDVLLTHVVLGQLLGVRRASVTECLDLLEKEGCIRISRGAIHIQDAALLRSMSCNCFDLIEREYQRLLGSRPSKPAGRVHSPAVDL